MRPLWLSVCCALLLAAVDGSAASADAAVADSAWSSSDPLGIPHEARLRQFMKGNLAPNPSFESVSVQSSQSAGASRLTGWDIVGEHVQWVDCDKEPYTAADCSDGRRAVKIERKEAGELAEAAGVLSAYIPVI